ncbi:hypothetical protein KEM48_003077 [Puccinia striiformis f. sp. tritici PST-130]|nr:hypothetical protein KEM48_003077 [Puccinia striiformis f. sp. tritici PST-130]
MRTVRILIWCGISAYLKIRYEPDSTLDKFPGHTEKISGNCVVSLPDLITCHFAGLSGLQGAFTNARYDTNGNTPKQVIEDGFAKMLSHCKEHPGTYMLPGYKDVKLSTRQRAPLPTIEDDSPLNTPLCLDMKDRPNQRIARTQFLDHNGDFANNVITLSNLAMYVNHIENPNHDFNPP